jgi:hypothetical protein
MKHQYWFFLLFCVFFKFMKHQYWFFCCFVFFLIYETSILVFLLFCFFFFGIKDKINDGGGDGHSSSSTRWRRNNLFHEFVNLPHSL